MKWLCDNLLWSYGKVPLLGVAVILVLALIARSWVLGCAALGLCIFSLYFFRNPHRSCPEAERDIRLIVCPADGKIVEITPTKHPYVGDAWKVSIFLSPFDVHVNWVPHAGTVANMLYRAGKFTVAYAPKSSEINERNDMEYVCSNGSRCVVRQIAGFVARRIVWWVQPGQKCALGSTYGMIRFGSRVELFIPRNTHVYVEEGQHVYGGQTVVGRLL